MSNRPGFGHVSVAPCIAFDFTRFDEVWFDEVHQHFVLFAKAPRGVLHTLPLPGSSGAGSTLKLSPAIAHEYARVVALKISVDGKFYAAQLSNMVVEVVDIETGDVFNVSCRKQSSGNRMHKGGIVWCEGAGGAQTLILVTELGLEIYRVSAKDAPAAARGALAFLRGAPSRCKHVRSMRTARVARFWSFPIVHGAPRSGLLLFVATEGGENSYSMRPYLLRSTERGAPGALLKLPSFSVPSRAVQRPPALYGDAQAPRTVRGSAFGSEAPCALRVATLYQRLYCLWTHPGGATVSLFALTRENAVLMRELTVPGSGALDIQLLDDLLVVHRPLSKLTLLYDVRAKGRGRQKQVSDVPLHFTRIVLTI